MTLCGLMVSPVLFVSSCLYRGSTLQSILLIILFAAVIYCLTSFWWYELKNDRKQLQKISACSQKLSSQTSQKGRKGYAVFSSTTPGPQDDPMTDGRRRYNYAFNLPLTVLSWSRLGFGSIVVLVGQESEWKTQNHTRIIYKQLKALDAIVVFLPAVAQNEVMLSQVVRLFVPNMAPFRHWKGEIIITSDSDLIPLSGKLYEIPQGKAVTIVNSECCGTFRHKKKTYKMWPLANIMMNASTWRNVMNYMPYNENCKMQGNTYMLDQNFADSILNYLFKEFGPLIEKPVVKGLNNGWFMDQHLVSIRVTQWMEQDLRGKLANFVPRHDTRKDRIDRISWKKNLMRAKEMVDSHLPLWGYREAVWVNMMQPLLTQLLNTSTIKYLENYRQQMLQG